MRNGCSDRLSRADVGSLSAPEIFDLYEGQVDEECGDDEELAPYAEEMRQAVKKARKLYTEQGSHDEAITLMLNDPDERVQGIGEALEQGYYAQLAI